MLRNLISVLIFSSLAVACTGDDIPRLPDGHSYTAGPVIAPENGRPCNMFSSDQDAIITWHQPPARSPDDDLEGPEEPIKFPGIQIHVTERVDGLDEIPVELVDPSTCKVQSRHNATFRIDEHGQMAYLVPLDEVESQIDPSVYIVRVASTVPGIGGIGNSIHVQPAFFLADPVCTGQLAEDTEIDFGTIGGERNFSINMDQAADVCVQVQRLSDFWVVREIVINQQRVHPQFEDTKDLTKYAIDYPGQAHAYDVKVALAKGRARVIIRVTPSDTPSGQAAISCGGGLQGYDDPFVETNRRSIRRSGVRVGCTAVYESSKKYRLRTIFGAVYEAKVMKHVTAPTITNTNGRFSATISASAIQRAGAGSDDEFVGVHTDCLLDSQCGVDRVGAKTDIPAWAIWLPIENVPDLAFSGLVARLITKAQVSDPLGFNTDYAMSVGTIGSWPLFGNAASNDLPVVFHEPFDPLREDGTEGVVWALGGQPTDYSKPNKPGEVRANACAGTIVGACFPRKNQLFPGPTIDSACQWSESCPSSKETQTDRFRCEGVNLLKIMLDKGYDVWIIDHVREDPTVLELATRSPVLYQSIADYPAREWFGRTKRKMTIVGISMGGVVARTGVRLWELRDELDRLGAGSELQLVRPDLLRDDADKRVSLFISYEGPHRGTLLPLSFQALIKDNTMPSRLNFSQLLNSRSAEQLTVPYVEAGVDTNCIKGGKPNNCTLRPGDIAPAFVNKFESTLMSWQAMDVLDALAGEPRPRYSNDHPPLTHDGLPTTMPAIAVSNGILNTGSGNPTGRFARIKLYKSTVLGDVVPDETVNLHNSLDPQGSGLSQICRLEELEESGRKYVIGTYKLRAHVDHIPTFVPTASSLHLDNVWPATAKKELPYRWHDVVYQGENKSHFNFDERQCQFLVYHLDGKMKGDKDGYPACRSGHPDCASGAKRPGYVIAPDGVLLSNVDDYCDPDDDDPRVYPPEIPGGVITLPDLGLKMVEP